MEALTRYIRGRFNYTSIKKFWKKNFVKPFSTTTTCCKERDMNPNCRHFDQVVKPMKALNIQMTCNPYRNVRMRSFEKSNWNLKTHCFA